MIKIIHYCWFGGKPLPKLAVKCIKSWKKFYPEFEIREWNEQNFDINLTNFSKEAYRCKKWAFVADVARTYALKEFGGLYFDTDMQIVKRDESLFQHAFFVGWESEHYVAAGILGVSKPANPVIVELFQIYNKLSFDLKNIDKLTIPILLTNILKKYGLINNNAENLKLDSYDIKIYSPDYFYPLSYDNSVKNFTDNTCTIHHFGGSWQSLKSRLDLYLMHKIGHKYGYLVIKFINIFFKAYLLLQRFLVSSKKYWRRKLKRESDLRIVLASNKEIQDKKYIVLYNPDWMGVSVATSELFENKLPIPEIFRIKHAKLISKMLLNSNIKLVIFSGFALGWENIIHEIKRSRNDIIIKVIWHGSNSLNVEKYDWNRFNKLFELHEKGEIDRICFVKKSMADFYKLKGYKVEFLMNNITLTSNETLRPISKNIDPIKVGLYVSGDRWVKNFYNQLAAASLIPGAIIECIPLSSNLIRFAEILNINISGFWNNLDRQKLLDKVAENDINLYVTFTECAPLIPLESFELGVPCITGNNHHYWENTELEEFVIVKEPDNPLAIHYKIIYCLENREKVLRLYKIWKSNYDIQAKESLNNFLQIE